MRLLDLIWARPKARPKNAPAAPSEGLDAFASEAGSRSAPRATGAIGSHPRNLVPGFLVALVLLQAGPTLLWMHEQLSAFVDANEETPLAAAGVPDSPVAPAAPCEPAGPPPSSAVPTGTSSRVTAPPPKAAPALSAGMLKVDAPVPMHVYSKGKLVGTTEADTMMLPVGTHELQFVSDEAGYRTSRRVTVQAARTSEVRLEAPAGIVHVNALPWAEVWIDNQRAGETPIGNFRAPIGVREVVFRHPELGERKSTVLVTLKAPARISVDLRQR